MSTLPADYRSNLAILWSNLCFNHRLTKGTKRRHDAALHLMNGVLFGMTLCGLMPQTEADRVSFLASIGRIEEYLENTLK